MMIITVLIMIVIMIIMIMIIISLMIKIIILLSIITNINDRNDNSYTCSDDIDNGAYHYNHKYE